MTDTAIHRPFGFWTATAYVVGGVIGAGIFVIPASVAPLGWNGVAAWIVGAAGAVAIALVLAAIARARPDEPGLMAIIGEVLGPAAGVVNGWGAWVSYWCANAYIALTSARYAAEFWPVLGSSPFAQAATASLIVAALTALNLNGVRSSGRFQVATTALKLLPMFAVMLIVGWLLAVDPGVFSRERHAALAVDSTFTAVALTFGAIIGFESASIAAQRVRDPQRNVPRATVIGVALCCLIYLVVCTGIVFSMPQAEVAGSNAPIAMFVARHWGDWAGLAIAGFAVVSTVGCLNVWVLMQGEVPLGLARAGLLPEWFGRTNANEVAVAPILIGSSCSVLLLLIASWGSGAALMDFMLLLTATSGIWVYTFACISALRLRVGTVPAVLGLGFVAALLFGAGADVVLLSLALLAAALPLYWLARAGRINSARSSATTAGPQG